MKILTSLGKRLARVFFFQDCWRRNLSLFNAFYTMMRSAITSTSHGLEIIGESRNLDWTSPPFALRFDGDPLRLPRPQSITDNALMEATTVGQEGTWLVSPQIRLILLTHLKKNGCKHINYLLLAPFQKVCQNLAVFR
jgi:hypothetical protein